jgi:hypothetical protein
MNLITITLFGFLGLCASNFVPEEDYIPLEALKGEKFHINLYQADNQVLVYVNDSLIYDTGTIDRNPTLDIQIELNDFLTKQENVMVIQLMNSPCPGDCEGNFWEIDYEIYLENDLIEELSRSSQGGIAKGGLVVEQKYKVLLE